MIRVSIQLLALWCGTLAVNVAAKSYDYLIIGGGAAGIVLAERLSQDSKVNVAVLEAGFFAEQPKTLVPAIYAGFIGDPNLDWGFVTTPQKYASNSVIILPRGKVLGGTAAVNGMYFVRAAKKEYDAWEQLGNTGWNWHTVDQYIKSIENFTPSSPNDTQSLFATDLASNHGHSGPINVTYSNYWEPSSVPPAFFKTMNALNVSTNKAAAGGSTIGVWEAPTAVDHTNRTRSYSVNGFYTPNKGRKNLVIMTGALATRINLGNGTNSTNVRATGVQYIINNQTSTINVTGSGNVILTAGTYQTPKLLELSGIGNSTILRKVGISPKVDLPGVGENLQDHYAVVSSFQLKAGVGQTLNELNTNATFNATQWQSYLNNRTGAYASVPGSTVTFLPYETFINASTLKLLKAELDDKLKHFDTSPLREQYNLQRKLLDDPSVPQIELVMLPTLQDPSLTPEANTAYLTIAANTVHPYARGSVHVNTTNPSGYPIIDPNYLGFTKFETTTLSLALKYMTEVIAKTSPLSDLIFKQLNPPANSSDSDLYDFVQHNLFSSWHPCGSASMLPKVQNGVVDANLKVYGTENVRVADASLIPLEIATHTMATVYANAAYAAEVIKA